MFAAEQWVTDFTPVRPHMTAALISGRDLTTNEDRVHLVVACQLSGACLRCGEPWNRDNDEPVWTAGTIVTTSSTGELEEFDRMHDCGEWAEVTWFSIEVDDDTTIGDAERLVSEMAEAVDADRSKILGNLYTSLRKDLAAAVVTYPGDDADEEDLEDWRNHHLTGSIIEPGVWDGAETGELEAWDFLPWAVEPDEYVTVTASELAEQDLAAARRSQ
ncbi:hypothetical protein GCM10010156_48770 [Planobispora rosea]|uniref:Uncharacterized protein n=1 Tax=Planobispora rosea TaxID=35762 RepID=A0A8J3WEM3_PLARO|nr:hypothetical protein [Planobispora rosea]GGS84406.1 hypothetical protein GCM10010156_48770 [Planobispora rosea]GIH86388.1 hypothetical protein Pro02_47960 [Planobispora rosea]